MRAIVLGSMASGTTTITNYLESPDTDAMISACRSLGATVSSTRKSLTIEGVSGTVVGASDVIDAGNSGLVLRFIAGVAGLGSQPIVITGDESIRTNRKMDDLLYGLCQLGVEAVSTRANGYAPVVIKGPMKRANCCIEGSDSQPVSALLLAAAVAGGRYEFAVNTPGETPFISMTLQWLERLGVDVFHDSFRRYEVASRGKLEGFSYSVPGDLSSCSFPLAAVLVAGGDLVIENVDLSDSQGDKRLIEVLREMGANIEIEPGKERLRVTGPASLLGIDIDVNDMIDVVPILAVVASYATGETRIRNAAIARTKECNRLKATCTELAKMGVDIEETSDGIRIVGGRQLIGADVSSHNDHRMAMALSVAALGASGRTRVCDVSCMAKTYGNFVEDMRKVGARMEVLS